MCSVINKIISVSHFSKSGEAETRMFKIRKAFNYSVAQNKVNLRLSINNEQSAQVVLLSSSEISNEETLASAFKAVSLVITDIEDLDGCIKNISQFENQWMCTKSILAISKRDFEAMKDYLKTLKDSDCQDIPQPSKIKQRVIEEYSKYSNVPVDVLSQIFTDSPDDKISHICSHLSRACEEKKLGEEERPSTPEEENKEYDLPMLAEMTPKKSSSVNFSVSIPPLAQPKTFEGILQSVKGSEAFKTKFNNYCNYMVPNSTNYMHSSDSQALFDFMSTSPETFYVDFEKTTASTTRVLCKQIIEELLSNQFEDIMESIVTDQACRRYMLEYLGQKIEPEKFSSYQSLIKQIIA
jgi:hypothetical protein